MSWRYAAVTYAVGTLLAGAAYLRYCRDTGFVEPYIALEAGVAVAYLETYAVARSPLADHPRIGPTDRGMHLMIGGQVHHRGLGFEIALRIIDWLFDSFPDMTQMVSDPSVHNVLAQTLDRKAGLREIDRVDLGYKQAVLFVVSRDEWSELRSAAGR